MTHGGWNSTIESLSAGVTMICRSFFGDQQTNCRYISREWECGMEIEDDLKRDKVEELVRELMEGKMKDKANEWRNLAENASAPKGTSSLNLDKLVLLLNR